jgi:hypothetical protein
LHAGFWKQDQHFGNWPRHTSVDAVEAVFSLNRFTNLDGNGTADDTMLDALNYRAVTSPGARRSC